MEIANLATTLQIAWYFNRAEKVWHPALKASIISSLFRKFYRANFALNFKDGIYKFETMAWYTEFTTFESLLEYTKSYIEKNFNRIQALVKSDPMLFIS